MGGHGFKNKKNGSGHEKSQDGLLGAVLGAIGSRLGDKTSDGRRGDAEKWGSGERGSSSQAFGRDGSAKVERRSRMPKFGMAATLVVLVLWTLFAWVGYSLVDSILAWTSTNVGVIVQTGKDAATATGIGTDVVGAFDSSQTTGFLGGLVGLVGVVLRPLIIVVWLGGAVLIMAAPWLVSLLRRRT